MGIKKKKQHAATNAQTFFTYKTITTTNTPNTTMLKNSLISKATGYYAHFRIIT